MYQFGQDDIKFLVLRVKDHMKTDLLITGSPVLQNFYILSRSGEKEGSIFQFNLNFDVR